MIYSKKKLKEYLEADKKSLGRIRQRPVLNDYIWKYEILLRKCEYYHNCKKGVIGKILEMVYRYKKSKIGLHCGFSIPINVCDKGLCLAHMGPVIINEQTKIGKNCRIHVGVNIGADARVGTDAPIIGNNVYIGPGAKIFGKVIIADNIAIGANAVVNKSFLESNISIAGIPAKKINNRGIESILND